MWARRFFPRPAVLCYPPLIGAAEAANLYTRSAAPTGYRSDSIFFVHKFVNKLGNFYKVYSENISEIWGKR